MTSTNRRVRLLVLLVALYVALVVGLVTLAPTRAHAAAKIKVCTNYYAQKAVYYDLNGKTDGLKWKKLPAGKCVSADPDRVAIGSNGSSKLFRASDSAASQCLPGPKEKKYWSGKNLKTYGPEVRVMAWKSKNCTA